MPGGAISATFSGEVFFIRHMLAARRLEVERVEMAELETVDAVDAGRRDDFDQLVEFLIHSRLLLKFADMLACCNSVVLNLQP